MQFLNPALLAGALLFAVPLLIHLLNRQRHKRRPWAAMDFLLRAYQKQRNRLRNENLLLLLLRCLIPILLALAIARPLLQEAVSLLTGGGTVHHVFVLDASYSMGLRQDGAQTPYERSRALVGRLLDRFEQNPNRNDKVTLVHAGVRPRFVVRGDLDVAAARAGWLQTTKPDDADSDLHEALAQVADAIEEANDPQTQVYVFTDLQARALGDSLAEPDEQQGPELADTLRDLVERIQQRDGLQLHWIDTGPMSAGRGGQLDNVQITDLRLTDPAAVQKSPAEVIATVRNLGESSASCEVTLEVDGAEPMRKIIEVPAGAEGEADFQLTFRTPGKRKVRAALVEDALAADDERFLTVDVRDRIRILLVDGKDGGDPLKSYAYLWQAMLDPDQDELPTFAVEVVDIVTLLGGQCTPKDHDVVVLADVERLNHRAATALTDALRAGSGVLFQFGPQ
ncbi:MAG: BatA domain-containing protein, partial [Planctomycetes bacterium]|nr:BatA domain-containing protein [Planctomycetota bacterium]